MYTRYTYIYIYIHHIYTIYTPSKHPIYALYTPYIRPIYALYTPYIHHRCIGVSDWTLHENLQSNNLGGMGPVKTDPAELRYSKVFKTGVGQQQDIDLVIKVRRGVARRGEERRGEGDE